MILLISAFQVTRVTGVSHRRLAYSFIFLVCFLAGESGLGGFLNDFVWSRATLLAAQLTGKA
jgi:hypothetical protein